MIGQLDDGQVPLIAQQAQGDGVGVLSHGNVLRCSGHLPTGARAGHVTSPRWTRLRDVGIATFKLPERLELRDELPRNPLGKVLKRDLREELRRA